MREGSIRTRAERALLDPLLPLAPVLDPILDPVTVRAGRALLGWWKGPPMRVAQGRARERALCEVAARHAPKVAALADGVRARDAASIAGYDGIVAEAVSELRGDGERRAAHEPLQRFAHAVDRLLYRDGHEWLDDPGFDARLRVRTLDRLDCLNEAIGSYEAFFRVIAPLVDRARAAGVARPVIVDLASGHAMFAVLLALRLGAREGKVRVVASDLLPEYLAIGRAQARRLAMDDEAISFVTQDALDLRELPAKVGAPVDVICCTQSLHHFSPGLVARMLAEAAPVARHGAIFVDGERNPFALMLVAMAGGLVGRGSIPFMHDSIASMRRMYTEQELALIGMLAVSSEARVGVRTSRGWLPPGHVWLSTAT